MEDKDGGPAFAMPMAAVYSRDVGMSLRDWFAGQAMASLRVNDWNKHEDAVAWCLDRADAMLAARRREP